MQLEQILNEEQQDVPALGRLTGAIPAWLVGSAVLVVCVALFTVIQFAAPGLAGNDGYYHVKIGYLMTQEGLTPAFDALPLTILNADAYYDHHLLYHLYLALFARIDPALDGGLALTQGAKVASVILPSLAFLAIWWLLRQQNVLYAALWTVALFAISEAFLYRMSMPRAQSGSLLLLVLAVSILLSGRYLWLAPLGFVFVWFYNAFPLLLLVVGIYGLAVLLLERRVAWQPMLFAAVGVFAGLVVNPYFPENIEFILSHLLPKVGESAIPVGNEWSPYRTWTLVENSGLALLAPLLGALALGWRTDRIDKRTLFALLLVMVFGVMLFKSRRFVEYYPPLALIFLAFSTAPLLKSWASRLKVENGALQSVAVLAVIVLLTVSLYRTVGDARDLIADSKPADQYAEAALWLRQEAPPDAMIFQTDWDDFTRLFFYNSDVRYTAGLDPTFLQLQDEALYEEWVDITRGRIDNPGEAIRDTFDASYVFSDLRHEGFLDEAADDPLLEEVYRDEYAVIFEVRGD